MKIIIDWDNTLFDTTRMRRVTFNLLNKYGATSKKWKKAWSAAGGKNYLGKVLYSIREHAVRYSKNNQFNLKGFLRDYFAIHGSRQYLYPDTMKFLRSAKRIGHIELVTFGHKRFQQWKLDMSGIKNHFNKVRVVPTLKAGQFHKIFSPDEVNIFIDDNAQEIDEAKKLFPEVIAIHIRRPGSWHEKQTSKYKDYQVRNLNEALKLIKLISSKITTSVNKGVRALRQGKIVVYPTDTAYGLGADVTSAEAVSKLWKLKERGNKPVHIMVSDLKMAKKYAVIDEPSEKLFKKLLPGALTIVSQLKARGPLWKKLSAGTGTIGIRIPDNKMAVQLVKKLGRPITTTSANPSFHISGGATPYSMEHSFKQFRGKKHRPDLYLDGGILPKRKTSTIVSVLDGKVKIFREGPITAKQISKAIK